MPQARAIVNCDRQGCTKEATGAIRVELWPHPAVQAMVAKPKPLLAMVMALYVCDEHLPTKITELSDAKMIHTLESYAASNNAGILVDRSQTKIVKIPFDDPELLLIQRTLAAANDSQPSPAGSPQGAGNGRQTKTPAA